MSLACCPLRPSIAERQHNVCHLYGEAMFSLARLAFVIIVELPLWREALLFCNMAMQGIEPPQWWPVQIIGKNVPNGKPLKHGGDIEEDMTISRADSRQQRAAVEKSNEKSIL